MRVVPLTRVWLNAKARDSIREEARHKRFVETGGPLFGFEADDGSVVVVRVFGPGPHAKHRPWKYVPDREATQETINRVFAESEGRFDYVGEWHSHPRGRAHPSGGDLKSIFEIASQPAVDLPEPLILIQATKPFHRHVEIGELAAYRWNLILETVIPLELVIAKAGDNSAV
jgi:integrative and conjugative element protein (TIGR02256 family)